MRNEHYVRILYSASELRLRENFGVERVRETPKEIVREVERERIKVVEYRENTIVVEFITVTCSTNYC